MSRGFATSLAALGLAATVALSTSPVRAQVSFITAPTYVTGDRPYSITVGDLDGDGDLDLATANSSIYYGFPGDVSVLKNNGNGTFAAPQNLAFGDNPTAITVGDIDGDGDLDLVTANRLDDTVSVLKNNSNGTFTTAETFAAEDGPYSITVGDLDGDGDLDIATANIDSDNVSVLKNNGNGTFATAETFAAEDGPVSITVGDLDRDGDLDLATANLSDTVSVLKNNGNGTFATAETFAAEDGSASITVGDLDGDGDLDLATANSGSFSNNGNTVTVSKNNGNGTFAAPQNFVVRNNPTAITVGDLDADGDLDLVTANDYGNVSVLRNNGNSTFATAQDFATGHGSRSIIVGDLDGDSDLDLATSNSNAISDYGNVSVLKNNGKTIFATAQNFAVGNISVAITVGDLDGDGDRDLITTGGNPSYPDYTYTVSVLKNNSNGTFAAPQNFATGDGARSITIGDLDGDGDLDLATANYFSDDVSVLKNDGNGTFATPQSFAVRTGPELVAHPRSITVGDLDGDGDLDLATANSSSDEVSVLKNNGNGTFAIPQSFTAEDAPFAVTVGDLDGDGDLDLATANNNSNNISVLKNNGNGIFATAENFAVEYRPIAITIGDLDKDGDLDLATANTGGYPDLIGTVSVLKNNGDGTFSTSQTFAAGDAISEAITIGDLDGDGDLDFATSNYYLDVSVLSNEGNGNFAAPQNFAIGSAYAIANGDLDSDGDLDLATANLRSATVSVLQSTTPTLQLSPSPNRTNPTPLAGQTVSGNIYVFASGKDPDFKRVQFYLDDPDKSGEPIRLERSAPFDFAGGTNMDPTITQAKPFDTRILTNGTHTITATFARTDGTYRTVTSTFSVSN